MIGRHRLLAIHGRRVDHDVSPCYSVQHSTEETSAMSDATMSRANLPIPDPQYVGLTTFDAKDPETTFPPIEPLRPPEGAPNVLVVLIDDVGFGASSTFGGPIATPNA